MHSRCRGRHRVHHRRDRLSDARYQVMNRTTRRTTDPVAIPGVDTPTAYLPRATSIAATVVRWSNRESPADQVLRTELKKARGLDPLTGTLVARMVFSYYRWLGWLGTDGPVEARLRRGLEMQDRFNSDPDGWPEAELLDKAVPPWASGALDATPAWARTLQREPLVWLRARPGLGSSLASQLPGAVPGPIPEALSYTGTEDLFVQPEFQNGDFEIQDLSSQMVGHVCAPQPGETWWDACAGEGGKTMHLSALMQNKGLIWASDRADWRLTRLKRRAARAKAFNYRAAVWDGGERLPTKTMFDGVLVDAPCSGVGTWQRDPHARWTLTPADVGELAAIQTTLLDRVAGSIKPGGRLIYSVCTLTHAETTHVASTFGASHPEFVPEPCSGPGQPIGSGAGGHLWLWPQDTRANGMFIAQWRRQPSAASK